MKEILEGAIGEYNAAFTDSDKDFRLECQAVEDFSIECMALDGIQLCTYCVIGMTIEQGHSGLFNMYNLIEWKYIKKNAADYIFYPWIKENAGMQAILDDMKVERCTKYGYLGNPEKIEPKKGIEDFHCYKTCVCSCMSKNVESVKVATDIMLNMNRKGKKFEELEQLSKILCCCKLDIMLSFFSCMQGYISNLNKPEETEEKKKLGKAIEKFYEDVVKLRGDIDKGDYSAFREIEETSIEIAQLLRERKKSEKYVLNHLYCSEASFTKKLEDFFASGNKWKVKKRISGHSCEDYMREIKRLTGEECCGKQAM